MPLSHVSDGTGDIDMNWQEIFYNLDMTLYTEGRRLFYYRKLRNRFGQVWITKDMRYIPVKLMRDSHVRNAFAYKARQLLTAISNHDDAAFEAHENGYWAACHECKQRGMPIIVNPAIREYSERLEEANQSRWEWEPSIFDADW
jgi:hypothetical protein